MRIEAIPPPTTATTGPNNAAAAPLSKLRQVSTDDIELRAEYERWAFRFELLAA